MKIEQMTICTTGGGITSQPLDILHKADRMEVTSTA